MSTVPDKTPPSTGRMPWLSKRTTVAQQEMLLRVLPEGDARPKREKTVYEFDSCI